MRDEKTTDDDICRLCKKLAPLRELMQNGGRCEDCAVEGLPLTGGIARLARLPKSGWSPGQAGKYTQRCRDGDV